MNRENIEALLHRWTHEAIAGGEFEVFDELLAHDVVDESGEVPVHGTASFKARAEAVRRALSDLTLRIDALIIEGDSIAWRWTLCGVTPSGERTSVRGANFQRLKDGRVVSHWSLRS